MRKIRLGLLLIVVSWLPIAQAIIMIMHHDHDLTTTSAADVLRLSIWGAQVLIGFVGLWLVSKEAMTAARTGGWRHMPANLWHLFWSGGHT